MKKLKYFLICASLVLAIQVFLLIVLASAGNLLDKYLFFYYPTIWVVERLGNFSGETRLTDSILLGVPLGVFLYSFLAGYVLTLGKR